MNSLDIRPDSRWEAFSSRDKKARGRFVGAVIPTGVYCRPGCPSRLPRPENVRFFATNKEAQGAGFRPCKRCRPDGVSLSDHPAQAVAKAPALIEACEEPPDLNAIAGAVGLSRHHFHRVFKS